MDLDDRFVLTFPTTHESCINSYECLTCGSLVTDINKHNEWHNKLESEAR